MIGRGPFPAVDQLLLLAGRLLIAAIFLHEALAKLGNYGGTVAYARAFGVPDAVIPLAIAVELGCSLLIMAGWRTRPAALALAGFCLVTAFAFHFNYAERNQLLHFEKNLAMAGGLLALAVAGPGRLKVPAPSRQQKD